MRIGTHVNLSHRHHEGVAPCRTPHTAHRTPHTPHTAHSAPHATQAILRYTHMVPGSSPRARTAPRPAGSRQIEASGRKTRISLAVGAITAGCAKRRVCYRPRRAFCTCRKSSRVSASMSACIARDGRASGRGFSRSCRPGGGVTVHPRNVTVYPLTVTVHPRSTARLEDRPTS